MKSKLTLAIFLCLLLISCNQRKSNQIPAPEISAEALLYLETALDLIEENSIDKYTADWDMLRSTAYQLADGAQTPEETYPAIHFVLGKLGNGHSYFIEPSKVEKIKDVSYRKNQHATGKIIDGKFGYILLPGFVGMDDVANDFATEIQNIIQEIDQDEPCAWIIDLRKNRGGNMWPMLVGMGPILGEGCYGSFIDPDGEKIEWCYKNGASFEGYDIRAKVNGTAYKIHQDNIPVAVLFSNNTASSGEAIVVSFRQHPNTRSFGSSTAGYSTANERFEMGDGAWIILTVSTFADRTGELYGGKIEPDVKETLSDELPVEAEKWFLEQPSCSNEE